MMKICLKVVTQMYYKCNKLVVTHIDIYICIVVLPDKCVVSQLWTNACSVTTCSLILSCACVLNEVCQGEQRFHGEQTFIFLYLMQVMTH